MNKQEGFLNNKGVVIIEYLIDVIEKNKSYLSEIDGLIGDGDHGINMSKGFQNAKKIISKNKYNFSSSTECLANVLMNEIGGSMGPLYGLFFLSLSESSKSKMIVSKEDFCIMLQDALNKVLTITDAQVGDKTLIDTLNPAVNAFSKEIEKGNDFCSALKVLKDAAIEGRDSTKDMIAKKGRSSRLGERSIGVMDAGATSCCLILCGMADKIIELL